MISLKMIIIISAILVLAYMLVSLKGYFYQSGNYSITVDNSYIKQLKDKGINIYAVSERASTALAIALSDHSVNERLNSVIHDVGKGVDVSIVGVQRGVQVS